MSDLHTQLAYVTIGVNALAAVIGTIAWLAHKNPRAFWWPLRAGQILVMLEAVIGAALLLDGKDLPRLHLVYGLTPIAVAFLAEQRALVDAILQRELAVMASSAFVVALLCLRASELL